MPAELLEARPSEPLLAGSGTPPATGASRDAGDDGRPELLSDPDRFGLLAFLGTVTMMFIGFTSAYIVRRSGSDWGPLESHPLLWVNTALLLASSVALERSREMSSRLELPAHRNWLRLTGLLGGAFVGGQYLLWQGLAARGVYLSSNPHSSFFYLLTGLHALHLLGGLVWFGIVVGRGSKPTLDPTRDGLRLFALYWHFLAGLWLYLLLLLFVI